MKFDKIYFLGIGGIGMSALARYFLHEAMTLLAPITNNLTLLYVQQFL